jgi:hypothetical protein
VEDGWLTESNGRELAREQHKRQYCAEEGMLIVSSYAVVKDGMEYSKENLVKVVTANHLIYQKWKNF